MKKTIFITGGTGGIGRAAALALAKQGHDIIIHGRDIQKGKNILNDLLQKTKADIKLVTADISSLQGIHQLADEVKKVFDPKNLQPFFDLVEIR